MKKVIIVFPDAHLAYSPTTLQLYSELNKYFNCRIYSFHSSNYHKLDNINVIYAQKIFLAGRILSIFRKLVPKAFHYNFDQNYRRIQLFLHLLFNEYHQIIFIDPISIYYAGPLSQKGTLVSLELTENTEKFLAYLNNRVNHLIIQNSHRKEIYFRDLNVKVNYIQNAPIYNPELKNKFKKKIKNQLVFGGTATKGFGILKCLEFILESKGEFQLIVKGNIPSDILEHINRIYEKELTQHQLILASQYEDDITYLINLSENQIGFAFYDFEIPEMNNSNYLTGPSGKMFKYFAAGVPVIALNTPGFMPIKEFNCGILIDTINYKSIKTAIELINKDYDSIRENCFKAATHFSFDQSSKPYLDSLINKFYQ